VNEGHVTTHAPLSAWLESRTPAPPPELAARLRVMTADRADRPASSEELLGAAREAMAMLLHDGCLTRPSALDLLAVDALVTYAFESAADEPQRIDALAHHALATIAALAEPYHA